MADTTQTENSGVENAPTEEADMSDFHETLRSIQGALGKMSELLGKFPPTLGKVPPIMGKVPPILGRGAFATNSSEGAGVIVRATVEPFGVAGDTELHISVKWPYASLSVVSQGTDQQPPSPAKEHAPKPPAKKAAEINPQTGAINLPPVPAVG
jgi:hypothetical protein